MFMMRYRTVVAVGVLYGLFSCDQSKKLDNDLELTEKIKEVISSGQKSLVMDQLTTFEWDSFLILTPYTNYEAIEEELRIDLTGAKHSNLRSRDDICQLIFFRDGMPVGMVEYPRYPGDFSTNQMEFIAKDSAVFDIIVTTRKTIGGENWIELRRQ